MIVQAADINIAEGKKQSRILQSEAEKQEMINAAEGAARAVVAAGEARAKSIDMVSQVRSGQISRQISFNSFMPKPKNIFIVPKQRLIERSKPFQ